MNPLILIDYNEYKCICKKCNSLYQTDYLHNYVYWKCNICNNKIWFNCIDCLLYSRRLPKIICFNCRLPYYEQHMSSGDIHRLLLK